MLFGHHLVVIRGGGDIATGVAYRLHRSGFPVVVLELPAPLTIRRQVALSSAVHDGHVSVEGMVGRLRGDLDGVADWAATGEVPVIVEEGLPNIPRSIVIDARMAKRPLDTTIDDAPLVIGLGPGFTVGVDCDAVVETARGHHLGRVLWRGSASPNTGEPGEIGGRGGDRVLRSPCGGTVRWSVAIGDVVEAGQVIGHVVGDVDRVAVLAPFRGRIRGLLMESTDAHVGLKIGDVDPRLDTLSNEISDKALAVGGGVLEAVLTWISAQS